MVNSNEVRSRIMRKGYTIGSISKVLHLSNNTLGKQIRNKADMRIETAMKLVELLDIPAEEIPDIFFIQPVAKCNLGYENEAHNAT